MKLHLLKVLCLLFVLNQNTVSFSQNAVKGIYHLVNNPSDAPNSPGDELPIYLYKASIELRWLNKLKCTSIDLPTDSVSVWRGKWSLSGKTIQLEFQVKGVLEIRMFEIVKLKSGNYIKPVNDYFHYYKKE
ncbi:hypothetical protein D3C71_898120 [compost metagenome]